MTHISNATLRTQKTLHEYLNIHDWKKFDMMWWNGHVADIRYCESCGIIEELEALGSDNWLKMSWLESRSSRTTNDRRKFLRDAKAAGINTQIIERRWRKHKKL